MTAEGWKRQSRMPRPLWLIFAVFSLLAPLARVCGAQPAPSPSPTFSIATVKPSDPNRANPDRSGLGWNPGGSFAAQSMSLIQLIEFADDFSSIDVDQRIIGGPKWIGSAKFDIAAKCDEETARTFAKMNLKNQIHIEQSMLQALLSDRFGLKMHHESRLLAVDVLVVTKGGIHMKLSTNANPDLYADADGPPGNWKANGVTMKALAGDLSALPEIDRRIVVDKTGLKSAFDFTLKWTPDPATSAAPASGDNGLKPDPSAPSLFTALQEQLGLKLEPSKEPVDVIVIDSAELPSPN
ncbi:MAG: TIGR03435 family protein [Terracidiphilus sp.]